MNTQIDPVLYNTLKDYLWGVARDEELTDYTLASGVIDMEPDDNIFHHYLGEISTESRAEHGVYLSALVHRKGGRNEVGPGLFNITAIFDETPPRADRQLWLLTECGNVHRKAKELLV